MSTLYDPAKIRALAATGDPFYQGAWWILRQQEAAQITGKPRASFMADKIGMDEARARVMREGHAFADPADYDSEWTRNVVALNPHSEEYRRLRHAPVDTSVVDAFTDYDLNA